MAIPDFDPRTGGGCSNCMANKFFSVVIGWVLLIIWILGFLTLVFKPSSVTAVVKNADTTVIILAGFLTLICIFFSVVLLIGLHKDKRLYIKGYLIFAATYVVLLIVSIIINLCIHPQNLGFSGFFSILLSLCFKVCAFLVIRSYYLITYCNGTTHQLSNQPKV